MGLDENDDDYGTKLTLVSRANATMYMMKRRTSAGQWRKLPANGKRKIKEKRMPSAATTSV